MKSGTSNITATRLCCGLKRGGTHDEFKTFLLNPRWQHFATIKASDLLLLNADDEDTMNRPDAPDASAWSIHGAVHAAVPQARVLLHCHAPYATTLCTLKDPAIKPIDQNSAITAA